MSIFGKIKDAIFGHEPAAQPAPAPAPATPVAPTPQNQQAAPAPAAPASPVDVEQVLTAKLAAKGNPDLNWRTSIVDLMKLLDLDSSLDNRKGLATELGYAGAKDGSAEMNIWLHNAVMLELVSNGARVPEKLAD
jgi:3-oxoacyl-ACP reductase-like protein